MSKQDIRVKDQHRWSARPYIVKAGSTAILAGEWVIQNTSGDVEYVKLAANGASTSDVHVGVAVSNSTHTASADGIVYVVDAIDALFVGAATTVANLVDAVRNTLVTLDVTSGVFTIDENDTSSGCFLIVDFNSAKNEVYFKMKRSSNIAV